MNGDHAGKAKPSRLDRGAQVARDLLERHHIFYPLYEDKIL